MDDISSVLGHDITYALQDSTLTDDTTTLCSEHVGPAKPPRKKSLNALGHSHSGVHPRRRNSSPPRMPRLARMDSDDNPQQFGFENIVFEIDNRCDDQKMREPPRYCSLAQFVEGNDIARQSFKVCYSFSYSYSRVPPSLYIYKYYRVYLALFCLVVLSAEKWPLIVNSLLLSVCFFLQLFFVDNHR